MKGNTYLEKHHILISPPEKYPRIDWRELYRYRDLFFVLAWRDVSVRYKQTVLGLLWALLQPFVTMVIFTVIFNKMAGIESGDGTPYPIFLYTGQLFWLYFSSTLSNSSQSLVANAPLLKKVYFPRVILPVTGATTGIVDFGIGIFILAGMMVYYNYKPSMQGAVMLPILCIIASMCSIGIGLALSSINVKYRDVRYVLPFFINTLLYVTPVIYPVSILNKYIWVKYLIMIFNPMTGVIYNARASILGNSAIDYSMLAIAFLVSIIYMYIGVAIFYKTERYFADIA